MPELPEVEVAARNLRRWAAGKSIRSLRANPGAARILRPASARALTALRGARVGEIRRIGKNLLVTVAGARGPIGIWSHLGMTGKWLLRRAGDPPPRFSRLQIDLDDGLQLHYADLRLFGRFRIVAGARFDDVPELRALGRDPLSDGIDVDDLRSRLSRSCLPIKVAILDQRLLPGVGNIQASESLYRAAIDPRRPAASLSRAEVARFGRGLDASLRFTLGTFAAQGADGRDADVGYVEDGTIENPFLVYGHAGAPCPRGKGGTITRIVQAQRATFFCPRCQH